ncbi:hypothetical protein M9H77_29344 [Catharanthus roseus]|uniref:Uncharacterized protein n=1 Tax=Catharanthus roseus TaxID=4058 RepID=A0ACC0AIJ4_CATRO|nr:hypothetical protein M9H77_29344 [Catharanthus roseus]
MGSLDHQQPKLPIIDFTKQKLESADDWLSTRQQVVSALEEFGFFIAKCDKVSLQLHQEIFSLSKELFDLPTETKVLNTSDTPSLGYVGQVPSVPLFENLGIENATTTESVEKFTNLLWPSGNHHFSETVLSYAKLVSQLDQTVMKMVSESYAIEKHYKPLQESMSYLLKLNKYRPAKESERNIGIVPHTDKSFMTILHQNQVKGLEIKMKDEEWILIDLSPSSFLVMAGEAIMAWTNGRIEAPQHRVIMSEEEDRYSLGLFTFIRDLKIEVPEELIDEDHPLQFRPFDHYKYMHFIYSEEGRKSESPIKAFCGI